MPDNTTLNTGSGGDVIATDDIAGVKYQRTKVVWGVDGAATDASASNPLPVVQTGALPAGANAIGKLAANSGVIIGDVNAVTAPATAADNAVGLPAVTTVVAGFDGTNVQALATNAAGNLQVGLSASLPAGANAIGKLAANSGVIIGDANVVSSTLPTGAATAAKQPALGTAGSPSADVITVQGNASGTAVPVSLPGSLTGKAEDGASASGDVGLPMLGVRRDVINTSWTSTDGDYMMLSTNSVGALYVVTQDPMPISDNGTSIKVDVNKVAGTTTDVNSGTKSAGTQRIVIATDQPQLTNAWKVDGSAVTQPVSGNVSLAAAAGAAGLTKFHLVSAGSTNATNVKAGAGKLHGWYIYNSNALARKVAFHNTAGTPTAGAGVTDSIVIPPASAANAFTDIGIAFSTGIAITAVTGLADSDATGVAANDLVINLYYV